jgi:uncharacterized protein YegP (UPF0339 family)
MAKFEIKKSRDGKFQFNLVASNGEIILSSQRYKSKGSAKKGIEAVMSNSGDDKRFETKKSKRGEPYFVLKAANGKVIGNSEMYSSEAAMKKGIASIKKSASGAEIKDISDKS